MLYSYTLIALMAATSVNALPLNINLGAYSPALVVGDGEISFGGQEDVSNLITALSGASQGAEAGAVAGAETEASRAQLADIVTAATPAADSAPAAIIEPVDAAPSEAPATAAPAANGLQSGIGMGNDIRPRVESTEADLPEAKEIAPREPEPISEPADKNKRDLAGFNAALNFAAAALKTSPGVELGTGEGGSGVGIIVKPGTENGAAAAAAAEKRDVGSALPTVTMLKIRTLNSDVKNCKHGHTL
ncbi:hypothetical protein PVAG01_09378 [Phlyctema vagabunda]|uniref:Uncharacterized protein n=1 Tax=Phlyctema vagabunda TaxID=108571 RepID=A0ABR4P762_9HELO